MIEGKKHVRSQTLFKKRLIGSYMNNTKWREVLSVAIELEFGWGLTVSDIRETENFIRGWPTLADLAEDHVRDPGFGGPIQYRDIFSLRVPRYEELRDSASGRRYQSEARAIRFRERLRELGCIETVVSEDYVEVRGYAV